MGGGTYKDCCRQCVHAGLQYSAERCCGLYEHRTKDLNTNSGYGAAIATALVSGQSSPYSLSFAGTGDTVALKFVLPAISAPVGSMETISTVVVRRIHWVEQEVLVTVCEDKDDYRFGFNGIHKENEIAGVGNHYSAFFGEYDPRRVGRWNRDPKPNSSMSPYSMFGGNPILNSDMLLDSPRVLRGHLTGYFVEPSQGPLAIANDINNPETQKKYGYSTVRTISYKDIVDENPSYFTNVKHKDDVLDKEYKVLNMNTGDAISLVRFTASSYVGRLKEMNASLQSVNQGLFKELETVSKEYAEAAKQYSTRVQQGKAAGGDPRSGSDIATFINTKDIREKVTSLGEKKLSIESKIKFNKEQMQYNNSTIKKLQEFK